MSQIEVQYDEFVSTIAQTLSNVDVNLLMKIMYLERKLTARMKIFVYILLQSMFLKLCRLFLPQKTTQYRQNMYPLCMMRTANTFDKILKSTDRRYK